MAEKIRKLTSLAIAFTVICLVAASFPQFNVVSPAPVMASPDYATYYFNAHDAVTVWTNLPDNMIDGNAGTYASTVANLAVQLNNANTCPGTDLGTISVVELRTYGYMVGNDTIELLPVFGGTVNGDLYPWTPPVGEGSATWSPYFDITADSGAPGSWTWNDVTNLDVNVNYIKVGPGALTYISIVEIGVTYTPAAGAYSGNVSQDITIADQATTTLVAGRGVSQGITITDGVTVAFGKTRDVPQGITISDGATATVARGRNVPQTITISDEVTAAVARGRNVPQTITVSDGVTATVGRARDVSQPLSITDAMSAEVSLGRPVSQGITVADGVTVAVGRIEDISQPLSITATTSTEASFSRSVTQGITISDGVTATPSAYRLVTQSITISDGVTAGAERGRDISQPLSIAATTSAEAAFSRSVAQGIAVSDGVTAAFARAKDISQPLSIAATTSTETSLGRLVSQGITVADGVTVAIGAGRDISQTLNITATVSAEASFSRPVSQGITVADGVTATPATYRPVTQDITMSDGVTVAVGRGRNISQTMSFTATMSAEPSFNRSVTQGITVSDDLTATPAVYRPVTQGITVSDGVAATVGKWSLRDVSQGITVSDGVTATVTPATYGGAGEKKPTPAIARYVEMDLFGTAARYAIRIGDGGKLLMTIEATSEDGMLAITIPAGTFVLDKDGNLPSTLTSNVDRNPPPPPEGASIIGPAYDFGLPGITFNPPATFTWSYAPETLPEDVAEENLVVAYYDEDVGEWVELPCTVDPVTHTITASVSHFTTFAIIARVPAALPLAPAPAPPPVVAPAPPAPPPAPPAPVVPPPEVIPAPAPPNWPLLGGIVAAVVVSGLLTFFLGRRRIRPLIYTALPKFRALVALLAEAKPKSVLFIRRIISYIISHVKH